MSELLEIIINAIAALDAGEITDWQYSEVLRICAESLELEAIA